MNKQEEIKKEIEILRDLFPDKHFIFFSKDGIMYISKDIHEALLEQRDKEIEDEIDLLDIELFLEEVVDAKTGKKVKLPKEIWDLWNIYWEHIKEKLKSRLFHSQQAQKSHHIGSNRLLQDGDPQETQKLSFSDNPADTHNKEKEKKNDRN